MVGAAADKRSRAPRGAAAARGGSAGSPCRLARADTRAPRLVRRRRLRARPTSRLTLKGKQTFTSPSETKKRSPPHLLLVTHVSCSNNLSSTKTTPAFSEN